MMTSNGKWKNPPPLHISPSVFDNHLWVGFSHLQSSRGGRGNKNAPLDVLPGAILLRRDILVSGVLRVIDVSLGVLVMAFATESLAGSCVRAERRRDVYGTGTSTVRDATLFIFFLGNKSDMNGRLKKKNATTQKSSMIRSFELTTTPALCPGKITKNPSYSIRRR